MPGRQRITTKMVVAIREERANGGWTNVQLAARYGISEISVSRITLGKTYAYLGGPIVESRTVAPQRKCWRGHNLATNRVTYGAFTGCIKCKRIRNREYMRKYHARQKQGATA
jgi:hypothetical protein